MNLLNMLRRKSRREPEVDGYCLMGGMNLEDVSSFFSRARSGMDYHNKGETYPLLKMVLPCVAKYRCNGINGPSKEFFRNQIDLAVYSPLQGFTRNNHIAHLPNTPFYAVADEKRVILPGQSQAQLILTPRTIFPRMVELTNEGIFRSWIESYSLGVITLGDNGIIKKGKFLEAFVDHWAENELSRGDGLFVSEWAIICSSLPENLLEILEQQKHLNLIKQEIK